MTPDITRQPVANTFSKMEANALSQPTDALATKTSPGRSSSVDRPLTWHETVERVMELTPQWVRQESCPECDGDGCNYCSECEPDMERDRR